MEKIAHKRQIKHISSVIELSIPFQKRVKLVEAEVNTNENFRNPDLPLEKKKHQNEHLGIYLLEHDANPEVMFNQTIDPNKKRRSQLRKCCKYCHKSNHYVSSCFRKQREDEKRKCNISFSQTKSPVKTFNQ